MNKLSRVILVKEENTPIMDVLQSHCSIPENELKLALEYGMVKIQRGKKFQVVRIKEEKCRMLDRVHLCFDKKILQLPPLTIEDVPIIHEGVGFDVCFKKAGLLSQGSPYGDHRSLLRFMEVFRGQSFLVHRLDVPVAGLMIVAWNHQMARKLSEAFKNGKVRKFYQAYVVGDLQSQMGEKGEWTFELEQQKAHTSFTCLKYETSKNLTLVEIELHTGRFHQIRKHFAQGGFPLWGDPLYGKNNKNKVGLKLMATRLIIPQGHFKVPDSFREEFFSLDPKSPLS
jgi:tRNA pseudouridine32 synthase/23S rRNA pseudouridine746 synthase